MTVERYGTMMTNQEENEDRDCEEEMEAVGGINLHGDTELDRETEVDEENSDDEEEWDISTETVMGTQQDKE